MVTDAHQPESVLRALQPRLAQHVRVRRPGYYGSGATGRPRPASDVDALVELAEHPGWKFFELEEVLEQALKRRVEVVAEAALKPRLRHHLLVEPRYV